MLRDDLTGGAFPWFSERDISFSKAPDEACRVVDDGFSHPESMGLEADLLRAFRHARRLERGQRTGPAVGLEDDDDDEPKTMAAAEAQKAGRAHSIEILNRGGEHAEILVDLWADPQSDLEGEAIVAGCPFGREHDGLRYLRRLKNHSGSAEILSSLRGQVNAERQQVLMDQADSLLLTERDRRLSELVQGAKLPKKILDPLLEAEWGALRAIRGRARDNQALMSYRIVVEEVLRDLLPLPHERPPQVSYEDLTSALPSRWEDDTAFRALADRISSLIPADDDGARLEVPGHLRRVAVEFVHSIQGGRPHRDATHGVHLQLLPFALAAVHPEGAQGLRMKRILGCHRGFWSDLCRVIDLCNPSHHAEAGPALSDTEKVERLNVVRAALSRVLPAISTPMLSESQGVVDV
jgi:hypothetical protein